MKDIRTVIRFRIENPEELSELNEVYKTRVIMVFDEGSGKSYFLSRGNELEDAPEEVSEYDWYIYPADGYYCQNAKPIENYSVGDMTFEYVKL